MDDVHHLPLRGRDLPDYEVVPLAVAKRPRVRAQIRKGHFGWIWTHRCRPHWGAGSDFYHMDQQGALEAACKHLKACR